MILRMTMTRRTRVTPTRSLGAVDLVDLADLADPVDPEVDLPILQTLVLTTGTLAARSSTSLVRKCPPSLLQSLRTIGNPLSSFGVRRS